MGIERPKTIETKFLKKQPKIIVKKKKNAFQP